MNKPNIISAGNMMSIVAALLGVVFAVIPEVIPEMFGARLVYNIPIGATLAVLGIYMAVMFSRTEKRPSLGTPVLIAGTLTALLGIVTVALVYQNPFSWMIGIVGMAIFIDALCLKISLRKQ